MSQELGDLDLLPRIHYNNDKEKYMTEELDTVVLKHDITRHNLKSGDLGTVVHIYDENEAFEVEFVTAYGKTVALLTLTSKDIRPLARGEMLHVRRSATL